jgi:DNA replication protein DnaC
MISLTTKAELSPKLLLSCGILEEYHDKGFEDYYGHPNKWKEIQPLITDWNLTHPNQQIKLDYRSANELLKQIAEYVKNITNAKKKGISLMLAGSNGTGKTLLGTAILKAVIQKGMSAQMTSLGGIIQCYTDGWGDPRKRQVFDERIKNTDFLLIDDVGKEYQAKNSDLTEIMFDNLIRYRVFRRKPFILTTNTAPNDLRNRYGNSLMSLLEGKTIKLKVIGDDYRKAIQSKSLWEELENVHEG